MAALSLLAILSIAIAHLAHESSEKVIFIASTLIITAINVAAIEIVKAIKGK